MEYARPQNDKDLREFHDYQVLGEGPDWPPQISRALASSKLLVPLITPRYFKSRWNVAEWKTFESRERRSGLSGGLILPLVVMDPGPNAPDWFLTRPFVDMRDVFPRLDTAASTEKIKALSERVSHALQLAPPFVDGPVVSPALVK